MTKGYRRARHPSRVRVERAEQPKNRFEVAEARTGRRLSSRSGDMRMTVLQAFQQRSAALVADPDAMFCLSLDSDIHTTYIGRIAYCT